MGQKKEKKERRKEKALRKNVEGMVGKGNGKRKLEELKGWKGY